MQEQWRHSSQLLQLDISRAAGAGSCTDLLGAGFVGEHVAARPVHHAPAIAAAAHLFSRRNSQSCTRRSHSDSTSGNHARQALLQQRTERRHEHGRQRTCSPKNSSPGPRDCSRIWPAPRSVGRGMSDNRFVMDPRDIQPAGKHIFCGCSQSGHEQQTTDLIVYT